MITIMRGNACAGFVLARGVAGYEGFDAAERSVGLFDTQQAAIDAVIGAAP